MYRPNVYLLTSYMIYTVQQCCSAFCFFRGFVKINYIYEIKLLVNRCS